LKFILTIIVLNLIYAIITVWNKKKLSIKLTPQITANIQYGDLFKSKGIIVIPVNEYFDTIVDDKIISSNTLHGYFIKQFFEGYEKDLRKQISESLSNLSPVEVNENRKMGNKKRYTLGTVAQVSKGDNFFYLVALTRFNENHKAEIKKSEYQRILCDLFDYIEQNCQGYKVNLPLIGGGHSGVNLIKQKLLDLLLFSITLNDKLTLINGVDIVLHKSLKSEMN